MPVTKGLDNSQLLDQQHKRQTPNESKRLCERHSK